MFTVPSFASRCKKSAESAWSASFEHPFVKGLIDGTLSNDRFKFYQMQDARYLEAYADVCSILSTRFASPDKKLWFIEGAKLALVVEQELHGMYGQRFGYTAGDIRNLKVTPNGLAYQNHMLVMARGASLLESVAALAPCPWLYTDIGLHIHETLGTIPADHPYGNWLATYSDPSFVLYTEQLLGILEEVALEHGPEVQERAVEAFKTSVAYEWMFWDQAWNEQEWPV